MSQELKKTGKRIWIEKTHVKNRADRKIGENSVGKALWSPQRDKANRDIYSQMRLISPGDVVIHLTDNESITRVSLAGSKADETFMGVPNTEWSNVPSYRILLNDSIPIAPPIARELFFEKEPYRSQLKEIRRIHSGLFFNSNLDLNQGSYITECPVSLARVFCEIYEKQAGKALPHLEKIDEPDYFLESNAARKLVPPSSARTGTSLIHPDLLSLALITKPFLILTGPSGTGKTRGAAELAKLACRENCHELVAVGADWTDNRHVLGYLNPLEAETTGAKRPIYETTPILDLILHANENHGEPHVLILDEMNLSHVERYFADFLSAMELEDKTGALKLHAAGKAVTRTGKEVWGRIDFPSNLFVIGTVNIDETTYMFSPKVLDRANVIEIHAENGALENFLKGNESTGGAFEAKDYGISFLDAAHVIQTEEDHAQVPLLPPTVRDAAAEHLMALFRIMKRGRGEYGFRTGKEVMAYLRTAHFLAGPEAAGQTAWATGENWHEALDAQILQKILPKLHGSRSRLAPLLGALATFCATGSEEVAMDHFPKDGAAPKRNLAIASNAAKRSEEEASERPIPKFKNSYQKLCRMIDVLVEEQFVSFIC